MKTTMIPIGPLGYISRFLGMASVLLGSALALMWGLAFVVIVAHLEHDGPSGPPLRLPFELPLVGLVLGAFGWLIARCSRQPVACPAIAGVIANAVPLALAALLLAIHALIRI